MRIFVDENIPIDTTHALINMGHDVLDIRGTESEGIPDENVWDIALREKRMLISTDKGFTRYRDSVHFCILMVCLKKTNRKRIHERILSTIYQFNENEWMGQTVMVKDNVQSVWKPEESGPLQ